MPQRTAMALHTLPPLAIAAAHYLFALDLVADPSQTLRTLLVFVAPVVIGSYSLIRRDAKSCSYWRAVVRGFLALPVGALLNAFGAIALGAPIGLQYWDKTLYWSCLMSLFDFVPAACAFGSSRMDWQRLLAHSKPNDKIDSMVSLPAHGAVIGAWFGAWPMPLDWERPWQEWPICVTYGAIAGYFVGILVSLPTVYILKEKVHGKHN